MLARGIESGTWVVPPRVWLKKLRRPSLGPGSDGDAGGDEARESESGAVEGAAGVRSPGDAAAPEADEAAGMTLGVESSRKRKAGALEEWRKFTPPCIDPQLCMARTWGRGDDEGRGAQCTRPPKSGERFCAQHLKQQGKEGWHGAVDEEIPAKKLLEFKAKGRPRTDAEVFGAERERR